LRISAKVFTDFSEFNIFFIINTTQISYYTLFYYTDFLEILNIYYKILIFEEKQKRSQEPKALDFFWF
jgi:hypothetical protein